LAPGTHTFEEELKNLRNDFSEFLTQNKMNKNIKIKKNWNL
jgi:hypothetical protein